MSWFHVTIVQYLFLQWDYFFNLSASVFIKLLYSRFVSIQFHCFQYFIGFNIYLIILSSLHLIYSMLKYESYQCIHSIRSFSTSQSFFIKFSPFRWFEFWIDRFFETDIKYFFSYHAAFVFSDSDRRHCPHRKFSSLTTRTPADERRKRTVRKRCRPISITSAPVPH